MCFFRTFKRTIAKFSVIFCPSHFPIIYVFADNSITVLQMTDETSDTKRKTKAIKAEYNICISFQN